MAAENTSRFITSDNRNLRYIGVDALSAIVQVLTPPATYGVKSGTP